MKKTLYVIIACLFLSSCARNFVGGSIYPDYNLAQKIVNGKIVRQVEGNASTTLVFGIGGLNHHRLLFDARENLLANASLKSNEYLSNIMVDYSSTIYLGLIIKGTYVISADVVELSSSGTKPLTGNNSMPPISNVPNSNTNVIDNSLKEIGNSFKQGGRDALKAVNDVGKPKYDQNEKIQFLDESTGQYKGGIFMSYYDNNQAQIKYMDEKTELVAVKNIELDKIRKLGSEVKTQSDGDVIYCNKCGEKNLKTNAFCTKCGNKLN
jgi:hypothetical protein